MPLYEYRCEDCHQEFERIETLQDPDRGVCPACAGRNTQRIVSRFAVGGQGDLRESTLHGCHGPFEPHHD